MKRALKIVLGLVGLVVLAVASLPLWVDGVARSAVEKGGTHALGVATTLDDLDLSLFGGQASLTGLTVANPQGYASPHFLKLARGSVAVSLKSVLRKRIEVPSLVLEGVDLRLDRSDRGANYEVLLENLKRLESGEKKPEEGKAFVIREVVLRDVRIDAQLSLGGVLKPSVPLRLAEVRFRNLGEEGVPLSRVIGLVLKGLLAGVLEAGAGVLPGEIAGGLRSGLGALGGVGELGLEVVGEGGKKVVEKLTKPLEDLFGGKDEKKEGD